MFVPKITLSLLFKRSSLKYWSSPDYSAAFHRGDFDDGEKLNAEDELDDGATVFVNIRCENPQRGKGCYKQGGKF